MYTGLFTNTPSSWSTLTPYLGLKNGLLYLYASPCKLSFFTWLKASKAFLSAGWLGTISTGLAFFGYVYLIEKIGAVKTSTVAYFLPIFGIIWGALFLNEVISIGIILGCFTILVGVFFATSNNKNKLTTDIHAN